MKVAAATGATAMLLFSAIPANAGATVVSPHLVAGQVSAQAVSCSYSTNWSESFTFKGVIYAGRGYAGHYGGLSTVPSKTSVTAAGVEAQCLLKRYGDYNPGTVDGVFGPNSQAAMRAFQSDMNSWFGAGLSVDGLPGPKTWPWLRWYEA